MMHLGDHAIIDVECYEDALKALRGADVSFFYSPPLPFLKDTYKMLLAQKKTLWIQNEILSPFYKNKTPPWKIWRGKH